MPLEAIWPRRASELAAAFLRDQLDLRRGTVSRKDRRVGHAADETQVPTIHEHHAVRHFLEADSSAGMKLLETPIEPDVFEFDVAQSASGGIDPQCAVDVDAVASIVGCEEAQPDLIR